MSDPVAGKNSSLGTSDCQGELSTLLRSLKKIGSFATKLCNGTNLFKRIPHRSGRTSFSSRFRRPSSLIWLAAVGQPNRWKGLSDPWDDVGNKVSSDPPHCPRVDNSNLVQVRNTWVPGAPNDVEQRWRLVRPTDGMQPLAYQT